MGGFSEVYASYSKLLEIFADFKIILNELKADSNWDPLTQNSVTKISRKLAVNIISHPFANLGYENTLLTGFNQNKPKGCIFLLQEVTIEAIVL